MDNPNESARVRRYLDAEKRLSLLRAWAVGAGLEERPAQPGPNVVAGSLAWWYGDIEVAVQWCTLPSLIPAGWSAGWPGGPTSSDPTEALALDHLCKTAPLVPRLRARLRKDRPMTTISVRLPEDVLEELTTLAHELGFSGYAPLVRHYIGQGLRLDLRERTRKLAAGLKDIKIPGGEEL